MHDLQRLTDLLNFLCRAVVPGRAFTRRMYQFMSGLQHHHLRVNKEIRKDLEVWKYFLLDGSVSVAKPFLDFSSSIQADELDFYTDACKSDNFAGFGCYFRPE